MIPPKGYLLAPMEVVLLDLVGKDFTCTNLTGIKDGTYKITAVRSLGWEGVALTLDGFPHEATVRFVGDEIRSISVPLLAEQTDEPNDPPPLLDN